MDSSRAAAVGTLDRLPQLQDKVVTLQAPATPSPQNTLAVQTHPICMDHSHMPHCLWLCVSVFPVLHNVLSLHIFARQLHDVHYGTRIHKKNLNLAKGRSALRPPPHLLSQPGYKHEARR